MAGLGAARSLIDAGWPVRLIEARDRVGGSVYTNRDWGVPIEMGASWIHGTANDPMMELARKARAQVIPTDYYGWAKLAVDRRLPPLDYDPDPWRQFVEQACGRVTGGSLAAALDAAAKREQLSASDRVQLAFFVATEIEDEFAAGADQLSAKTFDTGDYADGDQDVIMNGYDALPKLLADGLQIVLNTPVTAITRQASSVIVRAGNQSFEGPAAIVTVPLGVLKAGRLRSTRPFLMDTPARSMHWASACCPKASSDSTGERGRRTTRFIYSWVPTRAPGHSGSPCRARRARSWWHSTPATAAGRWSRLLLPM